MMQRVLAAVLVAVLLGCTSDGKQAETPPPPLNANTSVTNPKSEAEGTSTPSPTVEATPVSTSTPITEAAPTPPLTPTPETIPPEECEAARVELLDAETAAIDAATAIERFLNSPAVQGRVPEGLPERELDGSHIVPYQALAAAHGLTELLLNEEEWEVVTGWQQAWAVAESFRDDAELWDAAAIAVGAVLGDVGERFQDGQDMAAGTAGGILLRAAAVADWRAAWLRALAATSPTAMFRAHSDALDAAGWAFTAATFGAGGEGITSNQFTDSLADALGDRRTAAIKMGRLSC